MFLMDQRASLNQPRYAQIAQGLARLIDESVFRPGAKLPSARELAAQHSVSLSTAVQAFHWLEERQLIVARPKSGYFVFPRDAGPALPATSSPPPHSLVVRSLSRIEQLDPEDLPGIDVNFAGACPDDPRLFNEDQLRVAVQRAARSQRRSLITYQDTIGIDALRLAITRRALHLGCHFNPHQLLVTGSCIHAVHLCLKAVTQPGDVVALESPTHFGFLDLLESLNLRALEIPTHPRDGMSLSALQLALDTQPVKAVLSVPTLSNPLGAVMSLSDKRSLVRLITKHQVPLIEDVVFNDLLASDEHRKAAKAFDVDGWVMACGSFSKTLSPGIRLGWCEAGRWHLDVARLKRVYGVPTNAVLEHALADLLSQSGYEPRLRRLSHQLQKRLEEARQIISESFPFGTRVSRPRSGYTLWVELPSTINSMALFKQTLNEGICFGPGAFFSATDRFDHCLRLSFAGPWTVKEQRALRRIGQLAQQAYQKPVAIK